MEKSKNWFKQNDTDKIWWLDNGDDVIDEFVFSFDKKQEFYLYQDYPYALTKEQREIFDKENPFWAEFFADRK